jgi:hypothetical protein
MSDSDRPRGELRRTRTEAVNRWPALGVGLVVLAWLAAAAAVAVHVGGQRRADVGAGGRAARPTPGARAAANEKQRQPAPAGADRQERPPASRPESRVEDELRGNLDAGTRTLDLSAEEGDHAALWEAARKHAEQVARSGGGGGPASPRSSDLIASVVTQREDLRGLPLLLGDACETSEAEARAVASTASVVQSWRRGGFSGGLYGLGRFSEERTLAAAIRTYEQMFQTESPSGRRDLIEALERDRSKPAMQAVARRAVFDLNRSVRRMAVSVVRPRYGAREREVLLSALRHPWPPAADHAALALVELDDRGAVPALQKMLAQPDPRAPYRSEDGKWKRKELVRVNHLRSCLLCHPPSLSAKDAVRALVPTPGQPLPEVAYYNVPDTNNSRAVRADVVYLRQDFSAAHAVDQPHPWPAWQRFDYLVRARELEAAEAEALAEQARAAATYPQREAVRWALAELTGSRP